MKQDNRKRILAWIGIILLAGLLTATFVLALIDAPWAQNTFKMCLGFSILLPVLIYVWLMLHRVLNSKDDKKDVKGVPHDQNRDL